MTEERRPEERRALVRLHLWEIQPVQDLGWLCLIGLCAFAAYSFRVVTIPIAVAFLLAQIFDPALTFCQVRLGLPRLVPALATVLLLALAATAMAWLGVPRLTSALSDLTEDLPRYFKLLTERIGIDTPDLEGALNEKLKQKNGLSAILNQLTGAFGYATLVLGSAFYVFFALILTLATFVYFSTRGNDLPELKRFLPASRREKVWAMLQKFIAVFSGFLRGQVLVALFTTTFFSLGFTLVGVPHALVAAMVGGVLSFIPNGQASGWLLAVLFNVLDAGQEVEWLPALAYPTGVYLISQSLETFVVTPLVQGSYTRLHPLAVLAALLCGASVGGLFGVLLAIPLTACAKVALDELIAPALARRATRT